MRSAWLIAALPLVMGIALAQDTNPTPAPAPAATTQTQTPMAPTPAAELKSYKGTLVDASCAFPGSSTSSTANTANPPATPAPAAGNNQACPVSSSTTQFAVRLDNGQTVKVDAVGNVRAQDTIKNKKSWGEAASSGKPIHTKISGMLTGDTLTVVTMK